MGRRVGRFGPSRPMAGRQTVGSTNERPRSDLCTSSTNGRPATRRQWPANGGRGITIAELGNITLKIDIKLGVTATIDRLVSSNFFQVVFSGGLCAGKKGRNCDTTGATIGNGKRE